MKKSHLIIITCIILAGAFGLALMVHFANQTTPQPTTKTHKTAEKQAQSDKPKPQIRQTNSDPTLINIVNNIRTDKDLTKPIDDFEIVFYTQEDHNTNPNLKITTFPKSQTEPFIVKVPLGVGVGIDEEIAKAFIQYRKSQDPSLQDSDIIDQSKLAF